MPKEFSRSERVSDAVQKELASLIRQHVRDPRVGMVSVTDVTVSRDLAIAKIYVAFVGERTADQIKEGLNALNGASGYLRKLLSTNIALRATPKLAFFYDETGQRSQHLEALIDLAISSDKSNQGES